MSSEDDDLDTSEEGVEREQTDDMIELPTLLEPVGEAFLVAFRERQAQLMVWDGEGYGSSSCGYCSSPGERSVESTSKSYGSKVVCLALRSLHELI
jgi:hypothetical protein